MKRSLFEILREFLMRLWKFFIIRVLIGIYSKESIRFKYYPVLDQGGILNLVKSFFVKTGRIEVRPWRPLFRVYFEHICILAWKRLEFSLKLLEVLFQDMVCESQGSRSGNQGLNNGNRASVWRCECVERRKWIG